MPITTEPIVSVSATPAAPVRDELRVVQSEALRETIARLDETGSPVITDGEQTVCDGCHPAHRKPVSGRLSITAQRSLVPPASFDARLDCGSAGPTHHADPVAARAQAAISTAQRLPEGRAATKAAAWSGS
jgi:5-methyltetrahydropteroyltriglutamate--homocysteine methyltransferase